MDSLPKREIYPEAQEGESLPSYTRGLIRWLVVDLYHKLSTRINWLLSRHNDDKIEITATGNNTDEDDNWRIDISSGDFVIQKRVSGTWTDAYKIKGS